ncbi:MAG TPA: ABC transporter permease, partial [Chryseosolibacter sp.]|nr:ABC transporter permease [Chryseosolibacter sp.]
MKKQKPIPPRLAMKLLRLFIREELLEEVAGDLEENFDFDLDTRSRFRAKFNYWKQVFLYMRPFAMRTPKFADLLINRIMIGSYIKTSARNITRNKLFSTINIVGLAISMSVGLLLIAFASDLFSYDRFNENGSRIYRITSHAKYREGHSDKFASTSVRVGKLIREKVSGIQETAMIHSEFSGDAEVRGNVVPLTGMYAEPSLLRIFTLPMLEGNPATALTEPYSIVLTETSAKKLFGNEDAFGKSVHFDSLDYQVTGVLRDVPFFSHLQFESLVSYSTMETRMANDPHFFDFDRVWERNYVYVLVRDNGNISSIQRQFDAICAGENQANDKAEIQLSILPLYDIMLGENLLN